MRAVKFAVIGGVALGLGACTQAQLSKATVGITVADSAVVAGQAKISAGCSAVASAVCGITGISSPPCNAVGTVCTGEAAAAAVVETATGIAKAEADVATTALAGALGK